MQLRRLNLEPRTRKRVVWVLMTVAALLATIGVANLIDYAAHSPHFNRNAVGGPQEKSNLAWGLALVSIAYKVAAVALIISGVAYEVWRWVRARQQRLARKLSAIHDGLRGGGSH